MGASRRPAGDHLVPFGYLVFYSAGEVGRGAATPDGELPGALDSVYAFGLRSHVADVVGSIDFVGDIQVACVVEEFLHFSAGDGLVLFCGHMLISSFPTRFLASRPFHREYDAIVT